MAHGRGARKHVLEKYGLRGETHVRLPQPIQAHHHVPDEVPACGAFPIRVGDEWVATIAVSGYMEGLDHEIILRALEKTMGVTVPRWEAPVA